MNAPPRLSSRSLRWALTAALLCYAALALLSGADRLSASHPAMARLVPAFMRSEANRVSAAIALAREETERARHFARAAIDSDPIDRFPSALLGATELMAGRFDDAEAAYRVAASLGWRETSTQIYWYEAAIRANDYPRAAERLDAVMRTRAKAVDTDMLLDPFLASRAGQEALATRLALRPPWLEHYLAPPANVSDENLRARGEVITRVGARGTILGCVEPATLGRRLLDQGNWETAASLWDVHCPQESVGSGIVDPGFERLGRAIGSSPFGWQKYPRGDLAIRLHPDGSKGYVLGARNGAPFSRRLVTQALNLPAGTYRLSAKVTRDGKDAPGAVVGSADCGRSSRLPGVVDGDVAKEGQILQLSDCGGHVLTLWLKPHTGNVSIDEVRLEKLDRDAASKS